jgi:hypothetical protein
MYFMWIDCAWSSFASRQLNYSYLLPQHLSTVPEE